MTRGWLYNLTHTHPHTHKQTDSDTSPVNHLLWRWKHVSTVLTASSQELSVLCWPLVKLNNTGFNQIWPVFYMFFSRICACVCVCSLTGSCDGGAGVGVLRAGGGALTVTVLFIGRHTCVTLQRLALADGTRQNTWHEIKHVVYSQAGVHNQTHTHTLAGTSRLRFMTLCTQSELQSVTRTC